MTGRVNGRIPVTPQEDEAFRELDSRRVVPRTCRIEGCETRHPREHYCCPAHWRALPGHLRDAIWRAVREHGPISEEWLQAAENAEAWLEDRDALDMSQVLA